MLCRALQPTTEIPSVLASGYHNSGFWGHLINGATSLTYYKDWVYPCPLPPLYYTPGSGEHGPRFLTGGPGAAPGGVASKNGWVYMRVQGGFNLLYPFCPPCVSFVK